MKNTFIKAIRNMKIVELTIDSYEKGIIVRRCIPFDYGPSRKYRDKTDRYHIYTLNSPEGNHNISIKPSQLKGIKITDETFDPADFVTWEPNWFIDRDWGKYS